MMSISIEICKYVDWNGSPAMQDAKRSVGVPPEVNLRILLHTGDEACKHGHPNWKVKVKILTVPTSVQISN